MAQDVIQAKRIELLDDQGQPSIILTATDQFARAGLMMSSVEDGGPLVTVGIDHSRGAPFLVMEAGGEGGSSVSIQFEGGQAFVRLQNADRTSTIISA